MRTKPRKRERRGFRNIVESGLIKRGRSRRGNWGTWEQRVWKIFDPNHPFQN